MSARRTIADPALSVFSMPLEEFDDSSIGRQFFRCRARRGDAALRGGAIMSVIVITPPDALNQLCIFDRIGGNRESARSVVPVRGIVSQEVVGVHR